MEATYEGSGISSERPDTTRALRAESESNGARQVAGWATLGLGVAQLVAPGQLARALGLRDGPGTQLVIRGLGAAGVLAGMGLLRQRQAARPLPPLAITASATVNRTAPEVYVFWRDLQNLSRCLANVQSVEVLDRERSRWTAQVGRLPLVWEARITRDEPNKTIAWETSQDSRVVHRGDVQFRPAPGGRGTEIEVTIDVEAPGGRAGRSVARLAQALPRQQLVNDLRRLKQVLEVGEVVQSDASRHRRPHPARPSGGQS